MPENVNKKLNTPSHYTLPPLYMHFNIENNFVFEKVHRCIDFFNIKHCHFNKKINKNSTFIFFNLKKLSSAILLALSCLDKYLICNLQLNNKINSLI